MNSREFGVAIPAYRNVARLRRCLTSIERLDQTLLAFTTVVDDSGDGSVAAALKPDFPQVCWIAHETNQGFAAAANRAVLESRTPYVLLLNDDAELRADWRADVSSCFQDSSVFAVSLRSVDQTGRFREGAKRLVWRGGIAKVLHNPQDQLPLANGISRTSYAVGGHAVFRGDAFAALGGFDHSFRPFYWEDVDLSWRAQCSGLCVLYCDRAEIMHHDDGAIRATNELHAIRFATWRNRLLFSRRHARGLQRALLPVGIIWQRLVAMLRRDRAVRDALRDIGISQI